MGQDAVDARGEAARAADARWRRPAAGRRRPARRRQRVGQPHRAAQRRAPRRSSSAPTATAHPNHCMRWRSTPLRLRVAALRTRRCRPATTTIASRPTGHSGSVGPAGPHVRCRRPAPNDVAADDGDPAEATAAVGEPEQHVHRRPRAAARGPSARPTRATRARRADRRPCACASSTAEQIVAIAPERGAQHHEEALALERAAHARRPPRPAAKATTSGGPDDLGGQVAVVVHERCRDGGRATRRRTPGPARRAASGAGGGLLAADARAFCSDGELRRSSGSHGGAARGRWRPVAGARPSSSTRPSRMRTMRVAESATDSSWVTSRMAWPPACRRRNSSRTSRPPSESSAPVGSSASSSVGCVGQRPGDGQALALPAREHRRRAPGACRPARAGRAGRGPGSRPACAWCRR